LYHNGTQNVKIMIVISSREFREHQKEYFEKVDNGSRVIVQRGKNKSYSISPISEDDMYFTAEMLERLKESILQVESGSVKKLSTSKQIRDLLGL
jgi:antitoxin YefM